MRRRYFFDAALPASLPASAAALASATADVGAGVGVGFGAATVSAVLADKLAVGVVGVVAVNVVLVLGASAFFSSQPATRAAQGASARERARTKCCERFMTGERALTPW